MTGLVIQKQVSNWSLQSGPKEWRLTYMPVNPNLRFYSQVKRKKILEKNISGFLSKRMQPHLETLYPLLLSPQT